jgi:RimJ/RimL family protein N-acetyltransferase
MPSDPQPSQAARRVKVLDTARLTLRWLELDDAPFIRRLVNEPAWKLYIGDSRVTTLDEARNYLAQGPVAMYARLGFGLYLVELKTTAVTIGICGLLKRESLEDVDLGFALLQEFWGQGYALESAAAVVDYGRTTFGLKRLAAISSPENLASARLLEKLGFRFERLAKLKADKDDVKLYTLGL